MSSEQKTKDKIQKKFELTDAQLDTYWRKAWYEASGGSNKEPKVEAVRAICIRIAEERTAPPKG